MQAPHVYIVILNYLQWQDTKDCLESVLRSVYSNFSIIVIDNNSSNHSLEHLASWAGSLPAEKQKDLQVYTASTFKKATELPSLPFLSFIQNDMNAGFAGGNNLALRLLAGLDAYIWLLNPDMVVQEDTLTELAVFAAGHGQNSIIGARVNAFAGNHELLFYGGGSINFLSGTVRYAKEDKDSDKLDYISGSSLFTHAMNFKTLGLLPEDYFLYWEETDWCYRAKQQGFSLLVCSSAVCYDKISTVIGKGYLANYYYSRNGLLFISRFRKRNIPIALLLMKLRWLKRIITGQWGRARGVFRGTIDFLKKRFNAAQ